MGDRYLFRGKRIDNGEWVEGSLVTGVFFRLGQEIPYMFCPNLADYDCFEDFSEENGIFEVEPSTICQYTGLKDKNGKLIWENDIVDGHIKRGAAFRSCVVLWNECKARFDIRAVDCNFPMTLDECVDDISVDGLDYEVLGNKFDNPELLEVRL